MTSRPPIDRLGLSAGKKARLHRVLFQHGLGNGTALFLPYDQGLEHGPRDFFANPTANDPGYAIKLALYGGFKARQSMEAGATGLIFGRNVWQRPHDESLRFAESLRKILAEYPSP